MTADSTLPESLSYESSQHWGEDGDLGKVPEYTLRAQRVHRRRLRMSGFPDVRVQIPEGSREWLLTVAAALRGTGEMPTDPPGISGGRVFVRTAVPKAQADAMRQVARALRDGDVATVLTYYPLRE